MIETLESRQFLSATLAGEALCPSDPAPSTAPKADEAAVERKATGGGERQTYMTITMNDLLVTS